MNRRKRNIRGVFHIKVGQISRGVAELEFWTEKEVFVLHIDGVFWAGYIGHKLWDIYNAFLKISTGRFDMAKRRLKGQL